jgi:hypothetical protein
MPTDSEEAWPGLLVIQLVQGATGMARNAAVSSRVHNLSGIPDAARALIVVNGQVAVAAGGQLKVPTPR